MQKWLKLSLLAVLSLILANSTPAQGQLYSDIAWRYTPAGAFPASGATVTICSSSGGGAPCTPTISIFQDSALSIPVANPLAVCTISPQIGCIDGLGNFSFYMTPGSFTYTVTGSGLNPYGPIPRNTSCTAGVTCIASSGSNFLNFNNRTFMAPGTLYSCTTTGFQNAINAQIALGGGIVDTLGCPSMSLASLTVGNTSTPIDVLASSSTWTETGTITMNFGSRFECRPIHSCQITWSSDLDGIVTPTGLTAAYVTVDGFVLNNQNLTSASHAVLHYFDCPRCEADDVLVSFQSTAASAGMRVEAVTSTLLFGTWGGYIKRPWVQIGSGGTNSTGAIDLDFKGNSGISSGDISKWTIIDPHLEGGNVGFQIFCGSDNRLWGGDLQFEKPELNITGNVSCNSNGNQIDTQYNGSLVAGTKGYAIDANSNFNKIEGEQIQNSVSSTDAGSGNVKWLDTGVQDGDYDLALNNLDIGAAVTIYGNAGLPSATPANLYIAGSFVSPVLGKLYVGDGTGWQLNLSKRTASTDTDFWAFKDSGLLAGLSGSTFSTKAITNDTGLQLFNTTTTCTTASTINTPCTTGAITLPVAYSDTNYRLFCQGLGPTQFPQLQTVTKSNTTFTITLNNLTAAAASYTSFDCSAQHN